MIIGEISDILVPILTVVDVIVMGVLCLVVLMQRPKQEGLGAAFGSSMTDQVFGARTTDVLEKATRNLGILFIVVTIGLGIVVNRSLGTKSLVAEVVETPEAEITVATEDSEEAGLTAVSPEEVVEKIVEATVTTTTEEVVEATEEKLEEADEAVTEAVETIEDQATEAQETAEEAIEEATQQ